jgi:hypothetical protein
MMTFESVRTWAQKRYALSNSESYLLSFEVPIGDRRQGIYLAELERENNSPVLRVSTPICRMSRVNSERCLRFNWAQRVGFLAIGELANKDWLHLCENRPYDGLDVAELGRIVNEIAELGDVLEQKLSGKDQG